MGWQKLLNNVTSTSVSLVRMVEERFFFLA